MGGMRFRLTLLVAVAVFHNTLEGQSPGSGTPTSPAVVSLAPGVSYEARTEKTAEGQPWSVHVLRVDRKAKGVMIRAASASGEMRRELPTKIAEQEAKLGEELLAVVNGDYDIAAPYLGVSDGVSITSGHLWTTGKTTWPAMALRKNGEPIIAVPEVWIEMRAGKERRPVFALNKPIGSVHGNWPRAYTRDFRESVKSQKPFRAVIVGKLSRPLPLRANQKIRGEVLEVLNEVKEAAIPSDAIVIAGPPRDSKSAFKDSWPGLSEATFSVGQKVELRFEIGLAGRRDIAHAIGGFPIIVQGGKRTIVGEPGANLKLRHPRTAVCHNPREIIFVVVDGRQPQLSVGMTLEELGDLMVSLGCTEAMNTDGGGSSVMAVTMPPAPGGAALTVTPSPQSGGHAGAPLRIVNSPSDGKERGRGNAWVILKSKK